MALNLVSVNNYVDMDISTGRVTPESCSWMGRYPVLSCLDPGVAWGSWGHHQAWVRSPRLSKSGLGFCFFFFFKLHNSHMKTNLRASSQDNICSFIQPSSCLLIHLLMHRKILTSCSLRCRHITSNRTKVIRQNPWSWEQDRRHTAYATSCNKFYLCPTDIY